MAERSPAEIVLEALENLEQPTTPSEIVRYSRKKYPNIDESKIRSQVTISCVNMPTRVSFPENQTPRLANDPHLDSIYRIDFGQYVKYNPAQHEQWEIADVNGEIVVRKVVTRETVKPELLHEEARLPEITSAKIHGKAMRVEHEEPETEAKKPKKAALDTATAPEAKPEAAMPAKPQASDKMPQGETEMEQAAQLHQILVDRLNEVEEGLKAHPDPGAASKFPVPLSPGDILAQDAKGGLVILKVFTQQPGHQFMTDLLVNIGWAHENMGGKDVRAVVLSPVIPSELRFAAKSIPGVKLVTYEYKLVFSPVK